MDESVNYGNWVPIRLLGFVLILFIVLFIITIFPLLLIIKIILWGISGILLFAFLYLAYLYYEFSKNDKELQYKIWNYVLSKLEGPERRKVLDIGTGAGGLAIQYAKIHPEAEIWAIDHWGTVWDYSLKRCQINAKGEGVADQIEFKRASASKLPFNDGEFDAIMSNYVFHEVRDVRDKTIAMKEAFRVLKKGGMFSLQDLFGSKRKYGPLPDLIEKIKSWGVNKVLTENPVDHIDFPRLMKSELNKSLLLYGTK